MMIDEYKLHEGALNLEPLQNQLYNAIKKKSKDLARMYLSALKVLSQTDNDDKLYLTAHALREMMRKLPGVIDVPIEEGAKQSLTNFVKRVDHKWKKMCAKGRWPGEPKWEGHINEDLRQFLCEIQSMLEAEERIRKDRRAMVQSILRKQNFSHIPLPDDIEDMRAKEWVDYHDYFTKTAHYNPTVQSTFLENLKRFEYFLLNCLEPRTFEVQDEIKKIIEEGEYNTPNKEHVRAILGKIQRTADYDFFFENIKSADWLEHLDELKQFDRPRSALKHENLLSFPFWPPALYLVKIASQKPEKVMKIILKVSNTDNPRVHEGFINAALNMQEEVAVQLHRKVKRWFGSSKSYIFIFPSQIVNYIIHIKNGGYIKEALQVTDALLGLKGYQKQLDGNGIIRRADPIAGNDWEYNEALKRIAPVFTKQEKFALIKLLCKKLHQAFILENSESEQEFKDYSFIWRGSIESSNQNNKYNVQIKDSIINWIRDLSEELLTEAPELIEQTITYLRLKSLPIFSRFALHLARISQQPALCSKLILDQQLFNSLDVWHEYAILLKDTYPLINVSEQKKFLNMIEAHVVHRNESRDQVEFDEEKDKRSRYFYYYMISDYLVGVDKEIFEKLNIRFGVLENPMFHSYKTSWTGPTSPKLAVDLKFMQLGELKQYLEEWSPDTGPFNPSIDGLGRELESVVVD